MKPKLKKLDLYHTPKGWMLYVRATKRKVRGQWFYGLFSDAKRAATDYANAFATTRNPISVVLHDKKGKVTEELTFPRASDPRKSKW